MDREGLIPENSIPEAGKRRGEKGESMSWPRATRRRRITPA